MSTVTRFKNKGETSTFFSVDVTSRTTVLVYSGNDNDRETMFENTNSTYSLHCSTVSSFSVTQGVPRFSIPPSPLYFITFGNYDIYCKAIPTAGSTTITLLGRTSYDSKDDE